MARTLLSRAHPGRILALALASTVLVASGIVWASAGEAGTPPVRTEQAVIDGARTPVSTDRVRLDATLYIPDTAPAPAVLLPHGFGGDKDSVSGQARELAERGFTVLTYSARGFGHSTGTISLNDPEFEVADAQRLIDYLAGKPQVLTDPAGDPQLGVVGASYGGALALLLAGRDYRVDAIAPMMTYNDLAQGLIPNAATTDRIGTDTPAAGAFAPNGVFKREWAGRLFAAGSGGARSGSPATEAPEPGSETEQDGGEVGESGGGGASGRAARQPDVPRRPAAEHAPMCGRFSSEVCRAYLQLATTGRPTTETVDLLRRVSPASVTSNITVPTLLVQGENDTLFGLEHADATARQITAAGGTVDMVWYAGGHDGGKPGPRLRGQIGDWLAYQLTGSGQNPAAGFAYDVQGALRSSGAPSVRTVEARGYPGVSAGASARSRVELDGGQQTVLHPPGGEPAAVSGIPGLSNQGRSAARLSELFGVEPPGQSARFRSAPRDSQLLLTGASTVRVRVSAAPNVPSTPREPVLFAKLYDIGPDGNRTLPAGAVAPVRLPALPADGTPVEATVTLPAVVHPVEAGHSVEVAVGTTDRSFATPPQPAAYTVALAGDGAVHVPVVPGQPAESGWPVGQLLGIAGALAATGLITLVAGLRSRRASGVRDDLATAPLVIENLTKSYSGGLTAVDALSFRVEAGQVLGLLGPNGAGKTTVLRMLMGLVTPDAGGITVFGHRVTPGAPVLSRIGSFIEGAGFLPHLSGQANLRLYWGATGRPPQHAHLTEALEIAGLGDAAYRKVRTYSQGMRQRLAIAQAMLGLPELLVLDEPTNGLDPPQIHQMREVLRRYAATGRTVVVSSHLLAEVEQTCTHVVVMHRGGLVAAGAVGELTAGGGETTFTVDKPEVAAEALRMEFGASAVEVDGQLVHVDTAGAARSEAVAVLVRAGVAVEQAGPRRRLEDAFLRLVGEEARP